MSPRVYNDSIWAVLINFDTDFFTTADDVDDDALFEMHGEYFVIDDVNRTRSNAQAYCKSLNWPKNDGTQTLLFEPYSKEEAEDVINKVFEILEITEKKTMAFWLGFDISDDGTLHSTHFQYHSTGYAVSYQEKVGFTIPDPDFCVIIVKDSMDSMLKWLYCDCLDVNPYTICEMQS